MPHETPSQLHLGCGLVTPKGWLNVDGSMNARLTKIPLVRPLLIATGIMGKREADTHWSREVFVTNLNKPLPFPDASFTAVYCSHTLEHMYLEKADALLRECFRVLKPRGVARFVVPDLRAIVNEYNGGPSLAHCFPFSPPDAPAADRMCDRMLFHERFPLKGSFIWRLYSATTSFHWHKWMYDAESLAWHFTRAGFTDARQRNTFDSAIPGIRDIERADRIDNNAGIAVEGVKP
ncbi:MAG TPA: methyltransferase domain-containing protein [Phycisphaerales bacterium]|nr:methyltransferase domain-containing protein [Phycisphaerales bacterium]